MALKKAELKDFDSGTYTATVRMEGGYKVGLAGVPVARNLPVAEMTAGRYVALEFFDETNPRDAVVIAVYEA